MTRAEITMRLNERIAVGEEMIARAISTDEALSAAFNERSRFDHFNLALLEKAFGEAGRAVEPYQALMTGAAIAMDQPSLQVRATRFRDGVTRRISALQSALEQVEFYDEPPQTSPVAPSGSATGTLDPSERKARRMAFLVKLYELADGQINRELAPSQAQAALGMSNDETEAACALLKASGHAVWPSEALDVIWLTAAGVDAAESAATPPAPTPGPGADGYRGPMRLHMPRADLEAHLATQIGEGHNLMKQSLHDNAEVELAERARKKWENVVGALLASAFGDEGEPVIRWWSRINNMASDHEDAYMSDVDSYHPGAVFLRQTQDLVDMLDSFGAEMQFAVDPTSVAAAPQGSAEVPTRAFIVHGRDPSHIRDTVARVIAAATSLEPVILAEQLNRGRTLIEKFRAHATTACVAIVIMTGDDAARLTANTTDPLNPRPRQNVVLELGYFLALLPPERIIVLREDGLETPSDFDAVVYYPLDASWPHNLAKELAGLGVTVDHSKVP